ncbi:hypothetical protein [Streptomyces sp. NPDC058872]|uniref:hypothetical protein n=1 Tax=Streptomyces sp. NPDC058872 TaxID=3346661 RepID=UPI003692814F
MPLPHTSLDLTSVVSEGGGHRVRHDFLVDGRPLLRRLDEIEGADVVSPLAADLPPTVRAEHALRLLSADGTRQVIHSCPDCADPGCGAVTAVVLREGGDVVWRDFAWQTGPAVDLVHEGYPGIGPYRFPAAGYRSVLLRLLASAERSGVA